MIKSRNKLETTRFLSGCLLTVLLLMSTFHTGISSVKADVRCFCNLPVCVTSGYMCKSSVGVCISDHFGYNGEIWQSRHFCVELISNKPHKTAPLNCAGELENSESITFPTRFCCHEDMCNYFRKAHNRKDPVYRLNHSLMTGLLSNEDYFYRHGNNKNNNTSAHQHVWLKVTVIVVPIVGGFILIMLIVMAARMLKADYKRHRHFTETSRRGRLNSHVVYTGDKHIGHSLLYLPKSLSCVVLGRDSIYRPPQIHRSLTSASGVGCSNSLYKNVSIALSTDTGCTDASRDKYFVFDL